MNGQPLQSLDEEKRTLALPEQSLLLRQSAVPTERDSPPEALQSLAPAPAVSRAAETDVVS